MEFSKTETKTYAQPIVNRNHPPVVVTGTFAGGQGVLSAGTVLAVDANGDYVPYVPGAADTTGVVKCVLTQDIDTSVASSALVIRHGMVNANHIAPNDTDTINALADLTIYAV